MIYKISKLQNNYNLDIDIIEITNSNNYKVKFYTLGGYIHEVHIPYLNDNSLTEDVLLGYNNFEDLITSADYFNTIIGRVCNRISNSHFILNDYEYKLFPNTPPHHLHGGKNGFNKKIWKIDKIDKNKNAIRVTLSYLSIDLEENYPGNLSCKAIYELNNDNEFIINFEAYSDKDTIVNLTNHNYWNFHGHNKNYQNITNHKIKILSSSICETDSESIPTGNLQNVKETKFDLNNYFEINEEFLNHGGIDNNYSLVNHDQNNLCASVFSLMTKMGAEYYTNQPGIQFYTGNMMQEKYDGKYGKEYGVHYGMCLETQNFPDAINHTNFPSIILKKNEAYNSSTKIKLRNDF